MHYFLLVFSLSGLAYSVWQGYRNRGATRNLHIASAVAASGASLLILDRFWLAGALGVAVPLAITFLGVLSGAKAGRQRDRETLLAARSRPAA